MEQGKIMEAKAPTVRVGATPTGLMAPPPPQTPLTPAERHMPPVPDMQVVNGAFLVS